MKIRRRVWLIVLLLLLVSQLPFVYRRFKFRRLQANIAAVNSSRRVSESDNKLFEYTGVTHVHSFLGGHSAGNFPEIISAAQANQLQFVVMTEHVEKDFDTSEMTLKGFHGGVLFINGNEISSANGDRFLIVPGSDPRLRLVAYPEDFKGWNDGGYDGVEVYNVFTNAKQINPVLAFFDGIWSFRSYHDLMFATFYTRPSESLAKWDQALARTKLTATAGNDAHSNIGLSLNDDSGKVLLGLKLDPYATSFRLVRLHVLIENRDPSQSAKPILEPLSLIQAIKNGHCFIGFDLFGDTSGFRFSAHSSSESKIQGDEITLQPDLQLAVDVPVSSRVVILKDGNDFRQTEAVTHLDVSLTEKGFYRVEVYLPQLGSPVGAQPWIISNPIYVR